MDIKAADIEGKMKTGNTAMDVYNSLPMMATLMTTMVTLINEELGQYQLPPLKQYEQVPSLFWAGILSFKKWAVVVRLCVCVSKVACACVRALGA